MPAARVTVMCSLEGKIAVDKIAVMGQSCGGFLSIVLGADPRVKTIGVFNSGVQKVMVTVALKAELFLCRVL